MRTSRSFLLFAAMVMAVAAQPGVAGEDLIVDEEPKPATAIAARSTLAFPHASPTVLDHMPPALLDGLLEIYRMAIDASVAAAEAEAAWAPVQSDALMTGLAAPATLRSADESVKRVR